jgi:hypothetical protein
MRTSFKVFVPLLLTLTACAAQSADCPSEAEVQKALQTYITEDFWSPGERETWKITDVSGFEFGAMKTGKIIQKQVEYGKNAQDVCPIRVEYSFKATHADGRVDTTEKGKGETQLFYRDAFDEWTFKTQS